MIEALVSLVTFIAETLALALSALVDLVAKFFVAAGYTLSTVDLFLLLLVSFAEIVCWFFLYVLELIKAIFGKCQDLYFGDQCPNLKRKKQVKNNQWEFKKIVIYRTKFTL